MKNKPGKKFENKFRACFGILLAAGFLSGHAVTQTLPDSSLYQLRSTWITDAGQKLRLADLQGKPRLFTMFFGSCQTACPMVLARLKLLESRLPSAWEQHAGFVLVTMDPGRDDSGGLAAYRKQTDLRTDRYTLLRGNPEDTRELAMLLGIAYGPSKKNGGIEHTVAMILVDRQGRIIRRDESLEDEEGQLKALQSAITDSGH